MSLLFAASLLGFNALTLIAASWLLVRLLAPALPGVFEPLLAWTWAAGAVVTAVGVVLGSMGLLGPQGFSAAYAMAFVCLLVLRKRALAGDLGTLRILRGQVSDWARGNRSELAAGLVLTALLMTLAVLAAAGKPVVFDALTYRLSRIGQWLQNGRLDHFPTNDARQNYMPVAPDLFMAWLIGLSPEGFRFAALAQTYGGALVMASTFGFARLVNLSRMASFGAVALLFGMANVVPQFTSVDTDLFTAGQLAAAACLWAFAMRRREGSVLGGIGAGLAVGSKGTLFYLLPGLAIWVAWTAITFRAGIRAWTVTLVAAALSCSLFAVPVFYRNWKAYHNPVAPPDAMRLILGNGLWGNGWSKLKVNVESSFAQVFDPNSQPPGLRAGARWVGEALALRLPDHDAFGYGRQGRRKELQIFLADPHPESHTTSFGVLALLGIVGAVATAAFSAKPGAGAVLAWGAAIAVFWALFNAAELWSLYYFRFYVLVAPWMAVMAAWWFQAMARPLRRFFWAAYLLAAACVAWTTSTATPQAGWLAVAQPEGFVGYSVFSNWRDWFESLDEPGEPLRPALPYNLPLAAFYRLPSGRKVYPEASSDLDRQTAENAVEGRSGWLIVPATQFLGREGDVMGRSWLVSGDPLNAFSIAAYRSLRAGESPLPMLYSSKKTSDAHGFVQELLVRTWTPSPLRLRVSNAGDQPCHYELRSPTNSAQGDLGAGKTTEISISTAEGLIGQIVARFTPMDAGGAAPRGVSVGLAP